ncbi:MAG: site-2 protease family protein [Clostridia bacterium]|jgi:regulator of sigma E protease|nr:site-2 protease family protein [Clostridia bacterium]
MEGEEAPSDKEGSFSKANFWKKLAIVLAGPIINIIFGLLIYFILVSIKYDMQIALDATGRFIKTLFESIKTMISGGASMDDLAGPVGIATIVSQTSRIEDFIYLLSIISLSLGITNLIPIPPLDGGKILIYIIEWVKRKPLKEETLLKVQMLGFMFIIGLSAFVMWNDVARII